MSAQKASTDYDGSFTLPGEVRAGREAAAPAGPSRSGVLSEPGMNPDPGRFIGVNGVSLYVEEHGVGVPVLSKSTHRDRIAENGRIFDFELTGEELSQLDALDRTGGTGNALESKWW